MRVLVLFFLLGAGLFTCAAAGSKAEAGATYLLKAQVIEDTAYYAEVTGLPVSTRVSLNAGAGSVVTTDGAGKISGVAELAAPGVGGHFIVNVRGAISRQAVGATQVAMTLKGSGYALDAASNAVPASLALSFKATPLQFATQTVPVITINTNVAFIVSDGSFDANGALSWQTNLLPVIPTVTNSTPAYTNNFTLFTVTNLLQTNGTLFVLGSVAGEFFVPASNSITPGVSAFSFTNDWPMLQGTLQGTIRMGGQSLRVKDPSAALVQTHYTNWQGAPMTVGNTNYATVYSLLVGGSLEVTVLDSLSATVVQSGKQLGLFSTNYTGQGSISLNAHKGLSTAKGSLKGIGSSRGSSLSFVGTNGTLITSYDVNSNAPPVVVTLASSVGVPPLFSVINTISGILNLSDVVNYVTNGNLVIESHYGPADLSNPAYITNTVSGALKTLTFNGKIQGQAIPRTSAVNLDAQYQLFPLGVMPPPTYPF